ncbi:7812_t:CDS:2, partial [Acaulospora colombiana]
EDTSYGLGMLSQVDSSIFISFLEQFLNFAWANRTGELEFLAASISEHAQSAESWNYWGCSISEEVILDAAHALVSTGLNTLGYECECTRCRGGPAYELADPVRFPSGIKVLAGTMTCAKQYGSLGYEEIDAKTWKEWGIDYV